MFTGSILILVKWFYKTKTVPLLFNYYLAYIVLLHHQGAGPVNGKNKHRLVKATKVKVIGIPIGQDNKGFVV